MCPESTFTFWAISPIHCGFFGLVWGNVYVCVCLHMSKRMHVRTQKPGQNMECLPLPISTSSPYRMFPKTEVPARQASHQACSLPHPLMLMLTAHLTMVLHSLPGCRKFILRSSFLKIKCSCLIEPSPQLLLTCFRPFALLSIRRVTWTTKWV